MNSFLCRILPFKSLLVALCLSLAVACDASTGGDEPGAAGADKSTVLVTGANRGIGLELARQYSAAGWQVIGTARKPEQADELAALGVRIVQLDVTDPTSVARMAAEVGDQPIDILINNAGILPVMRSIGDIDFDTFARILDVNTVGPARVTQALIDNLQRGLHAGVDLADFGHGWQRLAEREQTAPGVVQHVGRLAATGLQCLHVVMQADDRVGQQIQGCFVRCPSFLLHEPTDCAFGVFDQLDRLGLAENQQSRVDAAQ